MIKNSFLIFLFSFLHPCNLQATQLFSLKIKDSAEAAVIDKKIDSYFFISNLDSVLIYNNKLLEFASKNNSKFWKGKGLQNYGKLYALRGNNSIALDYYQQSYQEVKNLDNLLMAATCKMEMGYIYSKQGKLNFALNYLTESYHLFASIGNVNGAMKSMLDMSIVYGENGNLETARTYCKNIINTVREGNLDFNLGNTLLILALQNINYNSDTSFTLLKEATELFKESNDNIGLIDIKRAQAQIYHSKMETDKALSLYLEVIDAKQAIGSSDGLPDLFCKVSEIQWQNNEKEKALKNLTIAEMQLPIANDVEEVLAVYRLLAKFYEENGNSILAEKYRKKYDLAKSRLDLEGKDELSHKDKFSTELDKSTEILLETVEVKKIQKNKKESNSFGTYGVIIAIVLGLIFLVLYRTRSK